jgi:hypothetical protein
VRRAAAVDLRHQGREGRGLAGAGGAAEEDEAAARTDQLGERGGEVQAREARHFERQRADRRRELPALAMDVDAETPGGASPFVQLAAGCQPEGEVGGAALVEVAAGPASQVRLEHLPHLVAVHGLGLRPDQPAVYAEDRRHPGQDQQIARPLPSHLHEKRIQGLPFLHPRAGRHIQPLGRGRRTFLGDSLFRLVLLVQLVDEPVELGIAQLLGHGFPLRQHTGQPLVPLR